MSANPQRKCQQLLGDELNDGIPLDFVHIRALDFRSDTCELLLDRILFGTQRHANKIQV